MKNTENAILNCPTAKIFTKDLNHKLSLNFFVIGLNHKTASLDIRERASVSQQSLSSLYTILSKISSESMILATCNRTEIYLVDPQKNALEIFNLLFNFSFGEHIYAMSGKLAIEHLFRVSSGLNSLVIGETQIQGQVKRALAEATENGTAKVLINKIVQSALAVGKKVRTETNLSDKSLSVSSVAVELAEEKLGNLKDKIALILGAGETAELTMTHLKSAGIKEVLVVNRTESKATNLADKFGGRSCPYEELKNALLDSDIIIASAFAPHWLISKSDMMQALEVRKKPVFLFDISMPRILSPDINELQDACLFNLDDLNHIIDENLETRKSALPFAERIIYDGCSELLRWYLTRQAFQYKVI